MKLWKETPIAEVKSTADNSSQIVSEIEQFCARLHIPLHIVDIEQAFYDTVVEYFLGEYKRGRTPNPCVICNKDIKFGLLKRKAIDLGAELFATGHYARIEFNDNKYHLYKAKDLSKDQSYFLYRLGQKELSAVLFPLGDYYRSRVQKIATEEHFQAASRKSSQNICFIGTKVSDFLIPRIKVIPGPVIDEDGNLIGKHKGYELYTVGQRCGIGIASGKRLYIKYIDPANNRIVVAPQTALYKQIFDVDNVNWVSGIKPVDDFEANIKVRYHSAEVKTVINPVNDNLSAEVIASEPLWAVSPGQSAVFYRKEEVIGGGIIV